MYIGFSYRSCLKQQQHMNDVFCIQTVLRPLYMSPVDQAGLHGYRNEFRIGFIMNWVSEMRNNQRSWGQVLAPNSRNKANMAKHKNSIVITFSPIIALATLKLYCCS